MLKFIQINVGGGKEAQALALQTAAEQSADFILFSEFYKYGKANQNWYCDGLNRTAIVLLSNLPVDDVGTGSDRFVWVTTGGMRIYSCYWPPNTSDLEYELFLRRLKASIRTSPLPVLVTGDFNAKHGEWSSPVNDGRGEALADMTQALDLAVCNCGSAPTREIREQRSYIDVTMVSASLRHRTTGWTVLDEETLSDHKYLAFNIETAIAAPRSATGWLKSIRKAKFTKAIETWELTETESAEESARDLVEMLIHAMDSSAPRKPQTVSRRKSVYWWSPGIAALRKQSNHLRRAYQRKVRRQGPLVCSAEQAAAKAAKLALVGAIRRAKQAAWAELCALVDEDPWGKPYRLVMARLGARRPIPGLNTAGRMDDIVDALFPNHPHRPRIEWPVDEPIVPITGVEVKKLASAIPKNKAPGLDDIPGEAVMILDTSHPRILSGVFNTCLSQGVFPTAWKCARLVLLRKADRPLEQPNSYRPLCMLDAVGKLFEKVLDTRLKAVCEANGLLTTNQYGFRRGRSTVDAISHVMRAVQEGTEARCMVGILLLDVKNAFNSAHWRVIADTLRAKGVPGYLCRILDSYFENRQLHYEAEGRSVRRELTAGVPQGSVLGQTLWNFMYDELLRMPMPVGVQVAAYADDIAIVAKACDF